MNHGELELCHPSDIVRLRPVIVHQAGQVQEGLDAVQVRADSLEMSLPPDASLGTPEL